MKKFSLKKILTAGIILATAVLTLTACGSSSSSKASSNSNTSSVAAIKKRGTIKVAVFGDLKPYGWVNKDGKRVGYDVTLARKIAKDLGVKIKFIQVNADSRVDALSSNKVDLVLANFTVTSDRKKVVDFADPYMKVSVGVISPKNALITNADQLKNKTVIVSKGTTAETYFTQKQTSVNLLKFDSKTQQFNALKNKRGVALADDNTYLYAWAKAHPNYQVGIKQLGGSSYISPAVKKGNKSLLKWTNKEITKLNKQKFFEKAYNSDLKPYFSSDVKPADVIIEK
ncbi:MAG: transporter substrate-binding domain-containing protein [Liquorilactobacillus nagelii]|jgi:polar amino acid transport system substrate-binding protein|uniref:transporter substrate-binding domain-containing protein n=1 Tax=Liquorilactobacillus nagelii TaxID=82688 RepID=UPI00242FD406|nr:transporter substrate-binding domain-containing protein [Liquorilactobacillus nagelii]MCI1634047.1 transporter substrate-binding domain-containing protein [Liquorilactobacillus nagelii]MCI1921910.1 transporter substrate-binding domain-containing protein [Liquorilactobacillus nagelii]MCI1976442.1 transporter substrate-binding domain-containing protein [Liquorilactobacillus nagelii]